MSLKRISLKARVSSSNLEAVKRVLENVTPNCRITVDGDELTVEGMLSGINAKELNRSLLSAMRRIEKRTKLRSEWTFEDGTTERYFDYVLKKTTRGNVDRATP